MDTETTGLDPWRHEILEIAIIRVGVDGRERRFHSLIKPQRLEDAEDRALEINGYAANPERWDDAPTLEEVSEDIANILAGAVCVGHNIGYDVRILEKNFERAGIELSLPHRKIDTITLVYEHLSPWGVRSAGLNATREFLGWSKEGAHTALKDTEDVQRLFNLLWRAGLWTQLKIFWMRARA